MDQLKIEDSPIARRATYWLIVERGSGRPELLRVGTLLGEEALAIFSFEEEALLFLFAQGLAEGWAARKVAASELVSVLHDSCSTLIALDPLPGVLGGKMVDLLSVSRERFLLDLRRRWDPAMAHSCLAGDQG